MPQLLRDHPAIRAGLDHFLTHDPRFAASGLTRDDVTARMDADLTLATLAETITSQQLSTKAAATIWGRVQALVEVGAPKSWNAVRDEDLRAAGLSFQKIKYIRGLVQAVQDETIDLKWIRRAPDDQAIEALTSLKGFGVWSAQMILIFTLARPNIWPAGDLGVQEGLRLYRRLKDRPDASATQKYGVKKFSPHASAAALLLWRMKDKTP